MNIGLSVILPSEDFLFISHLLITTGLVVGYIKIPRSFEWYSEYYDQFALYIDDFEEIPETFKIVKEHKKKIRGIMKNVPKNTRVRP